MKEKKTHSDYSQGNIEQNLIDVEALLRKPEQCSCGEKFQYTGLGHYQCPRCKSTFRNEYAIVRDFIDEFGSAYSILEIAERTGVPKRLIDLFVKDKRFNLVKKQRRCRNCKQPIEKGFYCNKCALLQIHNEMAEDRRRIMGSGTKDADMEGKMHYFKGKKERSGKE